MAWLVSEGRVLASLEVAATRADRRRGLRRRSDFEGALFLERTRWIHTFGLRFPIDVAYLDTEGVVLKTVTMHRFHIGIPMVKARSVIEARSGAFGRWGVHLGDHLEVRE